jgi:pSer/pThr/pTyr-binding forkhead associated (FHA) protein
MDFLANVETRGSLRLSANLNKVNLSFRRYGYLLEDKNFRNALLVNRRRVRRTLLRDGDVLDMGDLTLLYRDNRHVPIVRHSAVTPREGKVQVRFERLRGPVRKGTPVLVPESQPTRSFFVTKNLVFIGRSEGNDLIIKSQNVDYRHAKIERVGSRYKLLDLSTSGNTFVNNRRVEERILKEGDEISIDNQRFKYRLATKPVSDTPQAASPPPQTLEEEPDDLNAVEEGGQAAEEASRPSEART